MIPEYLVGAAACGLAGLLFYLLGYRRSAGRYDIIREVPTIAARDIPGLGAAMVEVKGRAVAEQPLISDLARLPCVAFNCRVTEHWTTTRTEQDSQGKTRTVTEHHSATRYSNEGMISFSIRDDSGEVPVNPQGASFEMLDGLALRGVSGPLADSPAAGVRPHHWNGRLSYDEQVFPQGQQAYVLGQVSEKHVIIKPQIVDRPFVISWRSEESLIRRALWGKRIYGILAAAFFLAAFILAGIGAEIIAPPTGI